MKRLLLIASLLMLPNCAAIVAVPVIYKGSQMANEATGGEAGNTLTEQDYLACEAGDEAACNRCYMYSAALGAFHCSMMHPIHQALPTISQKKDNYGGKDYNEFISKRR